MSTKNSKVCILIIIIISCLFVIVGCDNSGDNELHKSAIKTVINEIFTAPNDEYIDLMFLLDNATELGKGKNEDKQPSEYELKVKEVFSPFFTTDGYSSFVRQGDLNKYQYVCLVTNQEVKIVDISIEKHDTDDLKYNIVINFEYGIVDGEKKEIQVDGVAIFESDETNKMISLNVVRTLLHELEKIEQDLSRVPI